MRATVCSKGTGLTACGGVVVAAEVSVFAPLVAKAALASSSLGSGITQYLGVGFGGGTSGMADTWPNAQAFCNVCCSQLHPQADPRPHTVRQSQTAHLRSAGAGPRVTSAQLQ